VKLFGLLGVPIAHVFGLCATGIKLAGAVERLPLPQTDLDRVVGGDHLDRPADTDRLHGDPGLELGL